MELAMASHNVAWSGPMKLKAPRRTAVTENLRFLSFRQNEYARERELLCSITADDDRDEKHTEVTDKRILFRTTFQCQIVSSSSPAASSSENDDSDCIHVWHPPASDGSTNVACLICLEGYSPGQLVCISKKRKCNHIFHRDCMEGWMLMNPCCPLCRTDLMTATRLKKQCGKTVVFPP